MSTHSSDIERHMSPAKGSRTSGMRSSHYDALRQLSALLGLSTSLDELLHALATLTRQVASADLCVVLLSNQRRTQFAAHIFVPELRDKGVVVLPIEVDPLLCQRIQASILLGHLPDLDDQELKALNPLQNVQYQMLFPLPLLVGNECIGLINCYASRLMHYTSEELLLLSTLASQAALAIRYQQGTESGALTQNILVDALLEELLAGRPELEAPFYRRAHFLGCDLAQPHRALVMELAPVEAQQAATAASERLALYASVFEQVKQRIEASYPDSLLYAHDRLLVGLLGVGKDGDCEHVNAWLDQLLCQMRDAHGVHLSAGVGNSYCAVSDYYHSYEEAKESLQIGLCLAQQGGRACFSELGVYRYIYQFARTDTLRDQYQDYIDSIVEYDQRKKMNLLDTLETYLDCGGNIAKAATLLAIHRNTLLQRLDRLQSLCGCLQTDSHRLPLLVAIKIFRLRMQRAS